MPYVGYVARGMNSDYMTEDQRFASTRPDVLVYRGAVLEEDLTVAGPVKVDLTVSTSGTDSDFVVKLVDVYPGDYPQPDPPRDAEGKVMPTPSNTVRLGGYQQLVRGEPFRAKFRNGFETPVADGAERARRDRVRAAGCVPRVPPRPPGHGAGAELVVPADRSEPADVRGHPEGAAVRLPEGD